MTIAFYRDENGFVGSREALHAQLADVLAEVSDTVAEMRDILADMAGTIGAIEPREVSLPLCEAGRWDAHHDALRKVLADLRIVTQAVGLTS